MDTISLRRGATILVAWMLVALPAAAFCLGQTGTIGPSTALVVAATPFTAPAAWVGLATAYRLRRPVMLTTAATVATLHALLYVVVPALATPAPEIADVAPHDGVRVFSANVRAGNDQIQQLIENAAAIDADLVLLQEIGPDDVAVLERSVDAGYGYAIVDPLPGYFGGAVLSRWPIDGSSISVGGYPMISAQVTTPVGALGVVNVHAVAPLDGENHRRWRTQLAELQTMLATTAGPLVLAGDFNATPDHAELRRVAEAGNPSDDLQRRSSATFPGDATIPPLFALDHVIVSRRVELVGSTTLDVPGSDHRGLVVDLVLSSP